MQYSNSLKSSVIGNADTPKLAIFHPSNVKSKCNNNPPKVNKKKVTKLGAGHDVNQTGGTPLLLKMEAVVDYPRTERIGTRTILKRMTSHPLSLNQNFPIQT